MYSTDAQCTKNRIYEAYKIRLRVKLFIGNVYAWTNNNESRKNFADKFMMIFAHSEMVQQTQLVFLRFDANSTIFLMNGGCLRGWIVRYTLFSFRSNTRTWVMRQKGRAQQMFFKCLHLKNTWTWICDKSTHYSSPSNPRPTVLFTGKKCNLTWGHSHFTATSIVFARFIKDVPQYCLPYFTISGYYGILKTLTVNYQSDIGFKHELLSWFYYEITSKAILIKTSSTMVV